MEAKITEYAQYFAAEVSLGGAAATEQSGYVRVSTGITNLQKEVWALSKVDIDTTALVATGNLQVWGLKLQTASQGLAADIDLTTNYVLFAAGQIKRQLTAVGFTYDQRILTYDLTEPILMLPQNLYVSLYTFGANPQPAASVVARFWYRAFTMKEQDYWDLVQLQNPIIS